VLHRVQIIKKRCIIALIITFGKHTRIFFIIIFQNVVAKFKRFNIPYNV